MLSSVEQRAEEIPLDEGNWTQSGTLVWSPSQTPKNQENGRRTSEFFNPGAVAPPQQSDQHLNKPDVRQTKSSPAVPRRNNMTQQTAPVNKPRPASLSEKRRSRGSSSSTDSDLYFAETNSDTMKKGDFEAFKPTALPSVIESKKLPDPPDSESNLPSPGPVQTVPRLSKTSENFKSEPSFPKSPSVKRKDSDLYNDKTVKVKEAENYTPSYMDFYKDNEPDLIVDVVEEAVQQSNLSRRNSIDQRGIKEDKIREELRRDLDKVDMDYCAELNLLRNYFMSRYDAIQNAMSNFGETSIPDSNKLNYYGKLNKMELTLMLKFMNEQHEEELRDAKEHYDLEHRFLMNALRNTSDRDEEMRYNMNIRDNNEAQANSAQEINRRFQLQTEDIMRAIERIDYADAIAVE